MSFFKKLFGLGNQSDTRVLSHPRDLITGDVVKFAYLDQPDLSGKTFEVIETNTYRYGDMGYPEFVLKDATGHRVFLMVEEEDGEAYLALSRKVDKANLYDLISADDLPEVRSERTGGSVKVENKPAGFENWVQEMYIKVDAEAKGVFIKGDPREHAGQFPGGEGFTAYTLEDADGEFALELEVYETGEMELSVSCYLDISDIDEMWPVNTQG